MEGASNRKIKIVRLNSLLTASVKKHFFSLFDSLPNQVTCLQNCSGLHRAEVKGWWNACWKSLAQVMSVHDANKVNKMLCYKYLTQW